MDIDDGAPNKESRVNAKALLGLSLIAIVVCLVSACDVEFAPAGRFPGAHLAFPSDMADGAVFTRVNWSPSGDIALHAMDFKTRFPIYITNGQAETITLLAVDQQEIRGDAPILSPTGEFVAFFDYNLLQIRVLRLSQHPQELLLLDGRVAAWSPDGQQLAVMNPVSKTVTIRLFDLQGQETAQVFEMHDKHLQFFFSEWGIAWSPDGKKIAFALHWPSDISDLVQSDVYILSMDDRRVIRLTDTSSISEAFPSWSPDGSRMVFTTTPVGYAPSGKGQLTFANADGSCIKIAPGLFGANSPSWSPDGTQIAVTSGGNVYIVDVASLGEEFMTAPVCP